MKRRNDRMLLGAFIHSTHLAGWRHPDARPESITDLNYYKSFAQTAERGRFDLFFVADKLCMIESELAIAHTNNHLSLEPMSLLAALSAVTDRIGLAATISTSYNEPYHAARTLATLDHLSDGRAAWNIVTSTNDEEARNFGREKHYDHASRYERAKEFVEVAAGLWDCWEDGAFPMDRDSGRFADRDKLHVLDHKGSHFSVKGPMNIARPPQGRPILVHAGSSEAGMELAASSADIVFTTPRTLEEGIAQYDNFKSRLAAYGRSKDELKVMPGIFLIIGRTEAEAAEKEELLADLVIPKVGVDSLSGGLGFDISDLPLDGPMPALPDRNSYNKSRTGLDSIAALAAREDLTIRQFYQRYAKSKLAFEITGTPEQIADELGLWFESGAADGFNIIPSHTPGGIEDFVSLVVPELQKRGLVQTEYAQGTLREQLGFEKPANRFTLVKAVADKEGKV
ncbi:LLM class flavin-dependent oxidoreductase [Paenibacillus sp. MMO-177]|uniref:LLM class flavin-dependent oxidoreductase n=1 Tax=Paenibacillus sp. MMO-177 TaxID=3081289 RepID=UPI0030179A1A